MKFKSAAGNVLYVEDVPRSVAFYEKLGFIFKVNEPTRATAYINWWWLDFHQAQAEDIPESHLSAGPGNGAGRALFYFSVDNVQAAYDELVEMGIQPETEPYVLRGNKEFVVVDPDEYRLVIFKRK